MVVCELDMVRLNRTCHRYRGMSGQRQTVFFQPKNRSIEQTGMVLALQHFNTLQGLLVSLLPCKTGIRSTYVCQQPLSITHRRISSYRRQMRVDSRTMISAAISLAGGALLASKSTMACAAEVPIS